MLEVSKKTLRRVILGVIACIVVYWLLHEPVRVKVFFSTIYGVLSPFILGGVLAFILNVPMRAIENSFLKKIDRPALRRSVAMVLTFIAILIVLASVIWLLIPQIANTIQSLIPSLTDFYLDARDWVIETLNENPQLKDWLENNTELEKTNWDKLIQDALSVVGTSISAIVSGTVSAVSTIFSAVFNLFIGVVFSIYCLFQKETLARQGRKLLYAFIKEKNADFIIRVLRLTNSTFSNFLSGQCVEVCILGIMFAISMSIFRMPYIPLISVLIAVTAFIPIIGAWAGCVFGAFFILVENPVLAFWFVILFVVIQQIENNMIYPKVVGSSVGLSGMWVLLAVALGGELMGVAGMFLMIPLVSVLYTLIQELTNKKLSARGLDQQKLEPQPPELYSRFRAKRESKKKTNQIKQTKRKEKKK
ncbi:MAG: AI-2E family transporter [Oscillospiraceae bacterium]|nr:AI-2E family transporter [Oscillospiraceae bacterium]